MEDPKKTKGKEKLEDTVSPEFQSQQLSGRDLQQNFDDKMDGIISALNQPTKVALQTTEILNDRLRQLGAFFGAIRNRTDAIGFNRYNEFINRLLCEVTDRGTATCGDNRIESAGGSNPGDFGSPSVSERRADLDARPSIYGVDAYNLLRLATEAFLIFETGIVVRPTRDAVTGQDSSLLTVLVPDE